MKLPDRYIDLLKQGFMRGRKKHKAKVAPQIVACERCHNWHQKGKHVPAPCTTIRALNLDEVRDDLARLDGKPPYATWSNMCYKDGYFARSLEKKYGKSIEQLRQDI